MEWGHTQCEAEVKLDKALVAKIASEPKLEVKVGKHKVACNLEPEDGKESHKLAFAIDPLVTFENGKATKATLGWSDVDGSTAATAGGIDQRPARDALAGRKADGHNALAVTLDAGDLVRDILGALALCSVLEAVQQTDVVKPPLSPSCPRGPAQVVDIGPREALLDVARRQKERVRPKAALHLGPRLGLLGMLGAPAIEKAVLLERQIGRGLAGIMLLHPLAEAPDELDPEWLMRMLMGCENCWRMQLAARADGAR